jgi:aminoglycoside 3-N-acetyltransferase
MTGDLVERTEAELGGPVTTRRIVDDLRDLGVERGDRLLVHASLRSLGWVAGREPAVVDALREAVGGAGLLAMPTHTPHYCSPTDWSRPPIPDHWVETFREAAPPFRPELSPTRGMGAIPECFRGYPDVRRSDHPSVSFAAWGDGAEAVVGDHSLSFPLGEGSPLARLYDRDGDVLLLGTDHGTNTSVHLAEYRADVPTGTRTGEGPVLRDGEREWVEFEDVETSTDDFPEVGAAFEREVGLAEGEVGLATAKLASQRDLVDFAVGWFERNR